MTDFIGVYPKAMPDQLCDALIKNFNDAETMGMSFGRKFELPNSVEYRSAKDDSTVFSFDMPLRNSSSNQQVSLFMQRLQDCYLDYADKFSASLGNASAHASYSFRIQKTEIGQGYHLWHFEASGRDVCGRVLAWTVYLNDVDEGGETEFLYQHKRIKPEKGTVCIFPAAFTHTHRGNPPLSNTKYIVTGWYEY